MFERATKARFGGVLAGLFLLCATNAVNATTITFFPLAGNTGDPYNGHIEGGFTVTPSLAFGASTVDWKEDHGFGLPTPSITRENDFISDYRAGLTLINNTTGFFTFSSLDRTASTMYKIEGFLSGMSVFLMQTNGGSDIPLIQPVISIDPFQVMDTLVIELASDGPKYSVDNIVVNAVPEPTTLAILGLGLAGLGVMRRRLPNPA